MRIVIASGKGGAGKTTVTACLAGVWEHNCLVADADVEAPNLHLLLHPELESKEPVYLDVPELVAEACTGCGACREICSYGAIALLGAKIMIFQDMCHSCGGCFAVCQAGALGVARRELGVLESGRVSLGGGKGRFLMGRSRVGEAMSPPLLRALEKKLSTLRLAYGETDRPPASTPGENTIPDLPDVLMDAPPGVSCPAMTAARHADAVLLVVEPTPFGIYDFKLAYAAFSQLRLPMAVVMNRAGMEGNNAGEAELRAWCRESGLPLLAELPFEREAAQSYAHGVPPIEAPGALGAAWRQRFARLAANLRTFVQGGSHA